MGNVLKLLIYRSKTKINAATAIPPNTHNKRLGLFPLSMVFPFVYTHKGRLKIGEAAQLPEYDAQAENAWNLHEIRSGYPWISAATKETAVAQMLNQHIIGGVHFKKGCYPGQEIIARAQYRGQVKRGLAVLSGDSLEAAGVGVVSEGAEAGQIINTALTENGSLSLAVIKFSAAQSPLMDADGNVLKQEKLFFSVSEE